jgi:hypothetical protein
MIYDGELANMYQSTKVRDNNSLFITEKGAVTLERAGILVGNLDESSLLSILKSDKVKDLQKYKRQHGTLNNSLSALRKFSLEAMVLPESEK